MKIIDKTKVRNFFTFKNLFNLAIVDILLFVILLYLKYLYFFKEIEIQGSLFIADKGEIHTVMTLLLIGCLVYFFTSKKRKWILFTLYGFLTFLMYADVLYYRNFSDITSFSLLFQLNQVGDVSGTIFETIHWKDLFYLIDIVLIWMLLLLFRKHITKEKRKRNPNKLILYYMLWAMVICGNLYASLVNSIDTESRNSNSVMACLIGAVNFHIIDVYDFMVERLTKPELTDEYVDKIADSFPDSLPVENVPHWALIKDKNVLMVQMESMSDYLIDMEIEGEEVTPNLNKLVKESYYANNMHKQIGDGHTADAEFVTLNSLYPLSVGSAHILYSMNVYQSLPSILKEHGYATFSAHGFREEFWNRNNMHKTLGFEQSYFERNFEFKKKVGLGISDKDFFEQSIEKISTLPKPFFSFLITLQNHKDYDAKDTTFNVGELEGTKIGDYLQSAHEADKAIAFLIERLKEEGLDKNTLIILYGDHDAELQQVEMEKLFPDLSLIDFNLLGQVPFLMLFPNQELVQVNHQPLGQIDIMPTVLHLLGIKTEINLMYGENILSNNENKVVGKIKGWHIGKDYMFANQQNDITKAKAFDLETLEEIPITEEMIEADERLRQQINNSDVLIRTNGIKEVKNVKGNVREHAIP